MMFQKPKVGDIWSNMYFIPEKDMVIEDKYYYLVVEEIEEKDYYFSLLNLKTGKIGTHQVKNSFWRYEA